MAAWWVTTLLGSVVVVTLAALVWWPARAKYRERELARARKDFHRRREHLEAHFVRLASESGLPRGLEWVHCDFEDDVVYARNRRSGDISAFVGVTIGFEAIEGGGMEDVEAVGNLRAATAVFRVEDGTWCTDGRAIFNLNPAEAVAHYRKNLELVAHELAGQK